MQPLGHHAQGSHAVSRLTRSHLATELADLLVKQQQVTYESNDAFKLHFQTLLDLAAEYGVATYIVSLA